MTIGQGFDLAKLAGDGRIATGDVRAVPVGKYAKAALEKLGALGGGRDRRSPWRKTCAPRWRWSARGEAPLGIVYETDAKVEPNVKIVGALPGGFASADRLSGGADREGEAGGRAYLAFLRSRTAKAIFETIRLHVSGQADVVMPIRQPRRHARV